MAGPRLRTHPGLGERLLLPTSPARPAPQRCLWGGEWAVLLLLEGCCLPFLPPCAACAADGRGQNLGTRQSSSGGGPRCFLLREGEAGHLTHASHTPPAPPRFLLYPLCSLQPSCPHYRQSPQGVFCQVWRSSHGAGARKQGKRAQPRVWLCHFCE